MPHPPSPDLEVIATASSGLMLPSEQDAPFTPILWDAEAVVTTDLLRELVGVTQDAPIRVQDLDTFFAPLTAEYDWFDDEQRAMARRFAELRDTITVHMSDVSVYLIGETVVHVLIVGIDSQGIPIGLRSCRVTT